MAVDIKRRTRKAADVPSDRPLGPHVRGYGNPHADVMFVGEAPGVAEENARPRPMPFVGKTGREMSRLCAQAGFRFVDTYRTNVVKHRPWTHSATGNNPPSREEIKRDEPELIEEIRRIRPRFIAAVGRTAAVWFLGPLDVEDTEGFAFPLPERVKARLSGIDATAHGQHRNVQRVRTVHAPGGADWLGEVRVVVLRHPAAGFHSPGSQPIIYWDFMRLGKIVTGQITGEPPINEHPDPDYYEPRGSVAIVQSGVIAIDTEGLKGRVWGLSYSQTPGAAGVIRVTNRKALESFKKQLLGDVRR